MRSVPSRCLWLLPALVASFGCRPADSGASDAGPASEAALPLDVPEGPLDVPHGPIRLTPEKLDRFVAYQRRMVALYRGALAEDGGAPGGKRLPDARRLAELAVAERRAREETGLGEGEVREIERIVSDVLARRTLARTLNPDAAIAQLRALREKLGPEQQEKLEETLKEMTQHRDAVMKLTDERRRHGDANVDAVLAREEALLQAWNERLEVFLGSRPPTPQETTR